ncbi:MAG: hypothetical protein ACPGQL_07030 [Thermoplasmatota archaeon]
MPLLSGCLADETASGPEHAGTPKPILGGNQTFALSLNNCIIYGTHHEVPLHTVGDPPAGWETSTTSKIAQLETLVCERASLGGTEFRGVNLTWLRHGFYIAPQGCNQNLDRDWVFSFVDSSNDSFSDALSRLNVTRPGALETAIEAEQLPTGTMFRVESNGDHHLSDVQILGLSEDVQPYDEVGHYYFSIGESIVVWEMDLTGSQVFPLLGAVVVQTDVAMLHDPLPAQTPTAATGYVMNEVSMVGPLMEFGNSLCNPT